MKQIEFNGQIGDRSMKFRVACTKRHSGTLVEIYPHDADPVKRIWDEPKMRAMIEDIEALSQFDVGNQVIRVDFTDTERLARFFERFL